MLLQKALTYFGSRRTDKDKGSKFQGVETPSQVLIFVCNRISNLLLISTHCQIHRNESTHKAHFVLLSTYKKIQKCIYSRISYSFFQIYHHRKRIDARNQLGNIISNGLYSLFIIHYIKHLIDRRLICVVKFLIICVQCCMLSLPDISLDE